MPPLSGKRSVGASMTLIQQLDCVLNRLRGGDQAPCLGSLWEQLQPELRQQAVTAMAGSYVQIPRNGDLESVVTVLLEQADLSGDDGDLPDPSAMLAPLLSDQPVLVNGQLLPADDPRALLQLETLVSNWLVRTAELIGSELLESCRVTTLFAPRLTPCDTRVGSLAESTQLPDALGRLG